jgi:hypothetical protein
MDAERPKIMECRRSLAARTQKGFDVGNAERECSQRCHQATLVEGLSERERDQMTSGRDLMESQETARAKRIAIATRVIRRRRTKSIASCPGTPEQRTPIEMKFEQELSAKRRKNEGDRLRRLRLS